MNSTRIHLLHSIMSTRPAHFAGILLGLILGILCPSLVPAPSHADGLVDFTEVWFDDATGATSSIAWGDMDGDGDLDLAVGNSGEVNRVYRNDGVGAFQEIGGALGTAADATVSVAWGDMDGDGDLDLAVGNSGEVNQVYRNDGGGTFQEIAGALGTATDNTTSVAWGDVDSDGDLDLVIGNSGEVNRIYRNNGGGMFQEIADALGPTTDWTYSVAWGDMDGDGDLDLAVGNTAEVNRVYRNDGGGAFQEIAGALGTPADVTKCVAWGDMDGDGDLDLAVGNSGGFESPSEANRIYRNDDGAFTDVTTDTLGLATDYTMSVAWGDMDGDGDLDLAVGNGQDYREVNRVYLNDGAGVFQETAGLLGTAADTTWSVAWGDMDGDGDLDLAVGNYELNRLYRNDGRGTFQEIAGALGSAADITKSMAWGDIDGDGDLDLAAGNGGPYGGPYQVNRVYRNDGVEVFQEIVDALGPATDDTTSLAWGDMDGDGDLDLAVGNGGYPAQVNRIYRNDRGWAFAEVANALGTVTDTTRSVAWADADGDGDLDLAVGNDGQVNRIYQNDGGGAFQEMAGALGTVTNTTWSVAWGDADGDGDLDLAIGNEGQMNRVYRNDGAGALSEIAGALGSADENTTSVAWGDVDGDGDLDLAIGNWYQINRIYLNDGGGVFHEIPGALGAATDATMSVTWGDMDGDGDLDLAVGNWYHVNRVYLNNGAGTFHEIPDALGTAAVHTSSVAWGDVDSDGDVDLAVGDWGMNGLYRNGRQGGRTLPNNAPFLGVTAPYTSSADFYAASIVLDNPTIPITYTLFDPEGDPVGQIDGSYSPDGGGRWLPAVATSSTITTNLTLSAALAFDGVDDWVETAHFDIENDFTISFWTNPYTTTDGQAFIGKHTSDGANLVAFVFYDDGYHVRIRGDSFTGGTKTTGWQHLAVVGEEHGITTTVTVYRNGEVLWQHDFNAVVGDVSGGRAWSIGQEWDVPSLQSDFFGGRIDEVRIWNVARTQAEIQADRYRRLQGNEPGLVAYWPFDEGTGSTVLDQTTNGHNGSLGAGVTSQKPRWVGGPFATYVYHWDTLASGFFGQLDNVVFRTVVYPQTSTSTATDTYHYYNGTPGSFQWPYASATTFPFRVRGTQVRVYSETVHPSNTVENAMVYRLPAEQPTGGFPLADSSGAPFRTDHHGYLQGRGEIGLGDHLFAMAPVHTALNYAGALRFDGADDYVIRDPFHNAPITATTVSFWISTTQTTGGTPFSYASPLTDDTVLIADPHSLTLYRGKDVSVTTGVSVTSGAWHHIAVTWRSNGGEVRLYKDANLVYSGTLATGTVISPGGSLVLGQDQNRGGFFEGSLDEVRVWNTVLTQTQILDDMFGILGRNEPGLVLTWDFDNPDIATSGQCKDQSGNANDGALYGATWFGDYLDGYTVYHSSGTPSEDGIEAFTVTQPGVQVLTVTAEHPLILFDIDVSLEWDVSNDPIYLQQLESDLKRASKHLYDFTDGQVALGHVNVFQNADNWASSHVLVHTTNRLRPFAAQGGFVISPTLDPEHDDIIYGSGQVHMGATWNRYGIPGQNIGIDWPLILAHELGHFVLYLDDVYLGLNDDGFLIPIDTCTGSAMGDVYSPDNTEFIFDATHWAEGCADTLTERTLGRTEWETIHLWYPWLLTPTAILTGPTVMPFEFTTITVLDPISPTDALEDPTFYLDYAGDAVNSSAASAYLLRDRESAVQMMIDDFKQILSAPSILGPTEAYLDHLLAAFPDDFEYIYDLGSPTGGQNRLRARGAQPGDRLCVFDRPLRQYGCEIITFGDERLRLEKDKSWTPVIQLSPVNSSTFGLQVDALPSGLALRARLYPEFGAATERITLTLESGVYSETFHLAYPSLAGHVQVWVDETATELNPRREAIVAYAIGGNPGITRGSGGITRGSGGITRGSGGITRGSGGITRGSGGITRGSGGITRGSGAPLVSPDGQMIFFTENPAAFDVGDFYTVQNMAGLPPLPAGKTTIGQGYSLVSSPNVTQVITGSVSFQYLGIEALVEGISEREEDQLAIYFWEGSDWQVLDTVLNTTYNLASAASQGSGVYALLGPAFVALENDVYLPVVLKSD